MRWGHSHTFIGGLVAGLVLDREAFLLAAGCFVLGVIVALTWHYALGLVRWAWRRVASTPTGGSFRSW